MIEATKDDQGLGSVNNVTVKNSEVLELVRIDENGSETYMSLEKAFGSTGDMTRISTQTINPEHAEQKPQR